MPDRTSIALRRKIHILLMRILMAVAVALTGIAGPSGGSEEKPVGLVYAGLTLRGATYVKELRLGGRTRDRAYIRSLAAGHALDMARRAVLGLANR